MRTVVETINLCKTFDMGRNNKVQVLKGIDFSVSNGEFVSIMGPSGSGKSTLLYLLGGLDKTTSGKIKINGKEISSMKDKEESIMRRRDMGFIFQFYNLIPNLNVEENIMLPLVLDGKKTKNYRDNLDAILESTGLIERRLYRPSELSGGQQQRVAIARALINDPEIILADEPIGNLDSKMGNEIMELLKKINIENKKTIIQVTHSIESSKFGDRVVNMKDGELYD
ncbi:putative ABC transport system ATP-binding protein [Mobilisporobacter senegalensis]|uniref:Putative ABC transport system ATP-binding protein n=1 Tax=Mobilisporobacter senegalensis TaxID=1329262 RepID=A0A3N1XGS3_9FIRM|nr:ABC transporter ATP-binding protein [Mobilisporobacter senegalensis]ROR25874.1 putative ABC transport system ATP-binding protein [Mobilisporobacter senegalensis]